MPSQTQTTHTIRERKLIVYARKNVPYFQCRYKINAEWIKRTTGKTDLKEAINTAEAIEQNVFMNRLNQFSRASNISEPTQPYLKQRHQFKDILEVSLRKQWQKQE